MNAPWTLIFTTQNEVAPVPSFAGRITCTLPAKTPLHLYPNLHHNSILLNHQGSSASCRERDGRIVGHSAANVANTACICQERATEVLSQAFLCPEICDVLQSKSSKEGLVQKVSDQGQEWRRAYASPLAA